MKSQLVSVLTWRSSKMQLKREPDGVNGSLPRLRGAQEEPTLSRKTPVPDPAQQIHSVQNASQIANTSVLTAEKKKLEKLWLSRESNLTHKTALAQRTCPPALAPDTIRCAAREFSTHTATSTDGFAMRHFALLSDDALALVSQLFECMEMLGTIPQQLRYVLVVLIPKARTGLRPIGIFCALFRLWARCRTAMAQSWKDLNPRPSRPAKADRSLTQSGGTRSRWNAVSAKARKQSQFGGILHSSKSAWSTTSSKPTRKPFSFPLPVLRIAVSAYKMQRVLVLHGDAAPTGHTSRRVVAGCAIATYLVKLYCLPVLDNVVACILVFRLISSLTTHTSQPREHQGRPGDALWLLDEPSPRKPRNTCVSILQTKRQRSSRPIRNWRRV